MLNTYLGFFFIQVTSKYQNDVYKIKLEKDKSAWIAVYPKFGDITASIKYIDVTGKLPIML